MKGRGGEKSIKVVGREGSRVSPFMGKEKVIARRVDGYSKSLDLKTKSIRLNFKI